MIISGVYSLITKENIFDCSDVCHYEDDDLDIYAVNTTDEAFAQKIGELFSKKGSNCVNDIDTLFLAAVYEKKLSALHIFADITTSPLTLYYTEYNNCVFYSTSLKWLLKRSGMPRSINTSAAKAFLANGYVFGKNTLIENIFKLDFGDELIVSDGELSRKKYTFDIKSVSTEVAKQHFLTEIKKSVAENVNTDKTVFMPLSGGYDSNMIYASIREFFDCPVEAFTVGGKTGKNEIDAVKRNVSFYSKIKLHTVLVDESYYEMLADIVWRLDGAVCEGGIFLQYALAKAAAQNGAKRMLCGESSDEVQSRYYYESMRRALGGEVKENEKLFLYSDPFIGTNSVILKKSSIMLNSFGIHGCYPFKNKKVVENAAGLAKLNGTDKKYYKKLCSAEFSPNIIENIKTTGGTTNISAAMSLESREKLKAFLSKNELLNRISSDEYAVFASARTKRLRRQQGIKRCADEIKSKGLVKGIKAVRKSAYGEGSKLLKMAYLALFEQLFVSGKYDGMFENDGIDLKTNEVMDGIN